MRFSILGPLAVHSADGAVLPVGGTRLRRLLVLLLLTPGRTVGSDRLIRGIWADEPEPESAANALQALASRLRRALGGSAPLHGDATGYRLEVDPGSVDVHRFEELARRGRSARAAGDPEGAAALMGEALALWRGPALADLARIGGADDVAVRLAEAHRSLVLERLAVRLDLGRHDEALPDIEALAAREPHDERPVELLVRALAASGRQADALAAYDRLRRALAEDLGLDPSPHLQEVHLRLLRGELPSGAGRRGTAPPPAEPPEVARAAVPRPVKRLPHTMTSFVAREDEVVQVGALLAAARLVTLIGPGGAGKTRLSIEAASRFVGDRPDLAEGGVWFVELAPLREGADIPHALLSALELTETSGMALSSAAPAPSGDALDRVAGFLGERDVLLVLDNCEHLVAETAQTAEMLLARCPRLRLLATSREPLAIAGERLLPVSSLALPPEDTTAAEAGEYAAVRLFAERARAADPAFAVDAENAEHVVRVCRELDGMPLALELAAARLRAIPLAHLAARLSDRFRLLTNGNRFALPQHQTLQAVVDWSWELLDDAERALLRRLSAFAGGATLDAVEHVCSGGEAEDGRDVWSVLFALVDKSLVTAEVAEDGDTEPRYRMLETVRAYGAQRLAESGEEPAVRRAHAEYTLDLWSRADSHLRRAEQLSWLALLRREHDNLTAALRWSVDAREAVLALDLLHASSWYWQIANTWTDLVRWCGELLSTIGERPPQGRTTAYAHCLALHSMGADSASVPELSVKGLLRAEELLAESGTQPEHHPGLMPSSLLLAVLGHSTAERIARMDETAETHGDPWVRAAACLFGGLLEAHTGASGAGRTRVLAGLERFRAIGDRWGTAHALTVAAGLYHLSDLDRELELLTEGDVLAEEIGLSGLRAQFKVRRALCFSGRGRFEPARRELADARALLSDSGTRLFCRLGEADVAHAAGDARGAHEIAQALAPEVAAMNDVVRAQVEPTWLCLRSRTAMALGERTAALEDAAAAGRRLPARHGGLPCAEVLEEIAEVLYEEWPERGAILLGCAETVRGLPNTAAPAVVRIRTHGRRSLGAQGFDRAFAVGAEAGISRVGTWLESWLTEELTAAPPDAGTSG
ncbi:BTAD domain-containing putative transcriptional regulator [Streptomonospora litoralis]|uniref:HTH-type transcriptional regulator n=1 Tax=Streptomonospora litoralis TaxID=2498135 RepID=A0A4V0ZJV0_9ACTN|nr:BTAD domain-containing putative transcriptional regulator [Streptomonospora litoralis]QBI54752.1 Putative HTH-type transcriptional regulator [Streptomonospora litoralis]